MILKWILAVDGERFELSDADVRASIESGEWFHPWSGSRIFDFTITGTTPYGDKDLA